MLDIAPRATTSATQAARFLQLQPWFAGLPHALQGQVLDRACTQQMPRGAVALRCREFADGWYAVLSGLVKLQAPARKGGAAAFLALAGGEWFGEGTALEGTPRRYEVVALRDTELLCLPRALYQELLATSLPFNHAVLLAMNRRLGQAMSVIETARCGSAEQRLALYLSSVFWHGLRCLDLGQEELGSLAGLGRQTVNRALAELERLGLVSLRRGRVGSTQPEALMAFAGLTDS
jgi:CRP/FNR family transcriptional regulator, cyclic AMP receptor protein